MSRPTSILSWNIQWGLGVDGRIDLARIVRVIRAMADPDVICLQEVAQAMPDVDGADQVAVLAEAFPGTTTLFGAAVERGAGAAARRGRFGNLVLTRLPVLDVVRHPLPQPADATVKHMARQATEVSVATPGGALRVTTTHLEFHSAEQRLAQVRRLRDIHAEIAANERTPGQWLADGPYAAPGRPASGLFCGDFNMVIDDPAYAEMIAPFANATPALVDAWTAFAGGKPHAPTCGIFDAAQWPQGAHCRDFFFVTADLATRIEAVRVDIATDASDHQPVLLVLGG